MPMTGLSLYVRNKRHSVSWKLKYSIPASSFYNFDIAKGEPLPRSVCRHVEWVQRSGSWDKYWSLHGQVLSQTHKVTKVPGVNIVSCFEFESNFSAALNKLLTHFLTPDSTWPDVVELELRTLFRVRNYLLILILTFKSINKIFIAYKTAIIKVVCKKLIPFFWQQFIINQK